MFGKRGNTYFDLIITTAVHLRAHLEMNPRVRKFSRQFRDRVVALVIYTLASAHYCGYFDRWRNLTVM